MQAARLYATGDLRLTDMPIPTPGPSEVLVQVLAAGICGTDRHIYLGEFPSRPPVTLGHEFCGRITAIGPAVSSHNPGDLVTCDPNIVCGCCPYCLTGRINLCDQLQAIGIHRDGGFAGYVAVPAHRALILPGTLDPRHGAFCEPLACCLHGLDIADVRPGQRVIVLGGGVIGQLCVQLARAAGAEVMLITRQATKRDLAISLGAAHAAALPDQARMIWPAGADVVLECAGVQDTMTVAPYLTRKGGRVVILGVLPQGQTTRIDPFDLLVREIDLRFAFINPFTQSRAAHLIATGRVQVEPLISRDISLADSIGAIRAAALPGEVKVLICPS